MSKSKGNIIDPLEIIDAYGTDAMRMALCASSPQSREIDLDLRRFEEFKNFANKIWNGARFVFMNLEGDPLTAEEFSQGLDERLLALEDRWILSVLNRTVRDVNSKLGAYLFDQAALMPTTFSGKNSAPTTWKFPNRLFGKAGTAADAQKQAEDLSPRPMPSDAADPPHGPLYHRRAIPAFEGALKRPPRK